VEVSELARVEVVNRRKLRFKAAGEAEIGVAGRDCVPHVVFQGGRESGAGAGQFGLGQFPAVTGAAPLPFLDAVKVRRRRKVCPEFSIGKDEFAHLEKRRIAAVADRVHPTLPVGGHLVGHFVRRVRVRQPAEQGDEQAIVVDALLRLELAMEIVALDRAFDRPLVGDGDQAAGADALGRGAGGIEAAGVGATSKPVEARLAHAHARGGGADEAGIGQRLDELALLVRRPAVGARAQLGGCEVEDVRRRLGLVVVNLDQQLLFCGAGGEARRDGTVHLADAVGDALPVGDFGLLGGEGLLCPVGRGLIKGGGDGMAVIGRSVGECAMRYAVLFHLA
jgi:hypothetical protein